MSKDASEAQDANATPHVPSKGHADESLFKVFVGNLSYETTEEQLVESFQEAGTV
jgi:RNA recognition motif-containing protein